MHGFAHCRPAWSVNDDEFDFCLCRLIFSLGVSSGCTLATFADRADWNDEDGSPQIIRAVWRSNSTYCDEGWCIEEEDQYVG